MVKRALEGLEGVEKAEVSFRRAEAHVKYDPEKVTIEDMMQKVRDSGFRASIREGPK